MIEAEVISVDYIDAPSQTAGPFTVAAEVLVGSVDGSDIFQVIICNPEWLAQQAEKATAMWPRGHLIVRSFDAEHVQSVLQALVRQFAGSMDLPTFAERLNRYLLWEFEDMDDYQGEPAIPQRSKR